jgi:hypothetical protein
MDGWVLLMVTSNESIRSVRMTFVGGEHTHIVREHTEHRRDRDGQMHPHTVRHDHREQNILVNSTFVIYGDGRGNARVPLIAGKKYAFPFKITVPPHLVTSCYLSNKAYVKYVLHAEVDRPWAFDYNAYETPVIITPVDCNAPELAMPRAVEKDHEICCWPCSQGKIFFHTEIPFGGYFAGEKIPVTVEIHNQSSRRLPHATLTLVRRWRYSAQGQIEHFNQTLDTQVFPIQPGQDQTQGYVIVPPNLDVTSFHGRLISLDYFMMTELYIDGSCIPNTREEIPIVIGTIPRRAVPPLMAQKPVNPVFAAPPDYHDVKAEDEAEAGEVDEWPMDIPPPAYNENAHNIKREDALNDTANYHAQPAQWGNGP